MALMFMLAQNGAHGSEYAEHQMSSILPLLLLNKRSDSPIESTKMLLMMLLQDPNSIQKPNLLLPYLLIQVLFMFYQ